MLRKRVLWDNALVNALSTRSLAEFRADTAWWGRLVENAAGVVLCANHKSVEHTVT